MKTRSSRRIVRQKRARRKVRGSAERPRLAVYRSLRHISAQVIDDDSGKTLVSASSTEKGVDGGGGVPGAEAVGKLLAERAKKSGIESVVFDRAGRQYTGRVAKLASAAREAGLIF